jgi:hypothetical protein
VTERDREEVVAALLGRHGRTFAEELGIDVARNAPAPLFQLLVAAILFSARIRTTRAVRAARAVLDAGWTTPRRLADAGWERRVGVLNRSGYARYDERTSAMLGDTADHLLSRYDGDLRQLRDAAGRDPGRERELLKACKGLGDVGADIFFREVQVAWDELFPFADDRTLRIADRAGLGGGVDDLRRLVPDDQLPRLLAALIRSANAGDLDAVRAGRDDHVPGAGDVAGLMDASKRQLYEQARRLGVPGRSKMDKRELAQAVARAR